ncbi:divisome protein SepX/GlpR, partial [Pseudonocardia abyssalis]
MPSSLIFVGLVVLWLLILVPAVARHQQEVARPSYAALSGRVLDRPQRRYRIQEVDDVDESDDDARGTTRLEESARIPAARPASDEADDVADDDAYEQDDYEQDAYEDHDGGGYEDGWERPAPRYRPGRGGFDPEAAAITARARYAFRQRVVLGLLVTTVLSALIAVIAVPALWWLTAVAGAGLVGYLVYLRRQVTMEESIRDRRAARMAGTRRRAAAEDPELDEWARRGREAARPAAQDGDGHEDEVDDADDELDGDLAEDDPDRVA